MDPTTRVLLTGLIGWLLPGAGHLFIGDRKRGLILLITIAATFWLGVGIGGVKNTVAPGERGWWFVGQICAGGHALATMGWASVIPDPRKEGKDPAGVIGYGRSEEVSAVYTSIAGMLNLLVLLDAMARADRPAQLSPVPVRAGKER